MTPPAAGDGRLDRTVADALEAAGIADIGYAYLLDLQSHSIGQSRSHELIYPASIIKVPIMTETFRRFAGGELSKDATVAISESNVTTTAEETPFVPSYIATIGELVERMITHSDNIATNQLIDVLGRRSVTDAMRRLGLEAFFLGRKLSGSEPLIADPEETGRNRLCPADAGRLLALIAMDQVPGATEQMAILNACVHDEKLAQGLSPDDRFFHKTGETSEVSHDAGILETAQGKRYVIVLYTSAPHNGALDLPKVNSSMSAWMRHVRATL